MTSKRNGAASVRIPPLRNRIALYVDDSEESNEALRRLGEAHVEPLDVVRDGSVEPWRRTPLLIDAGGFHEGLKSIEGWIDLMVFWSTKLTDKGEFVFKDTFRDPKPSAPR